MRRLPVEYPIPRPRPFELAGEPGPVGLRVALGIGWIVLVPVEMLGVNQGLGYAIINARDGLAYSELMAVVVVIGLLGFLLDGAFRLLAALLERRSLRHQA